MPERKSLLLFVTCVLSHFASCSEVVCPGGCETFFDGCNTLGCSPDGTPTWSTYMFCFHQDTPYCMDALEDGDVCYRFCEGSGELVDRSGECPAGTTCENPLPPEQFATDSCGDLAWTCEPDGSGDGLCADKTCGEECDTSDGFLTVMRYCQPDGTCSSNDAPACEYDGCEDKGEGDTCTVCAPSGTDCIETEEVKTCQVDSTDGLVCLPDTVPLPDGSCEVPSHFPSSLTAERVANGETYTDPLDPCATGACSDGYFVMVSFDCAEGWLPCDGGEWQAQEGECCSACVVTDPPTCHECVAAGRSWQVSNCNPTEDCAVMDVSCYTTDTACDEWEAGEVVGCCETFGYGAMMVQTDSAYEDDVTRNACIIDSALSVGGGQVHHAGKTCVEVESTEVVSTTFTTDDDPTAHLPAIQSHVAAVFSVDESQVIATATNTKSWEVTVQVTGLTLDEATTVSDGLDTPQEIQDIVDAAVGGGVLIVHGAHGSSTHEPTTCHECVDVGRSWQVWTCNPTDACVAMDAACHASKESCDEWEQAGEVLGCCEMFGYGTVGVQTDSTYVDHVMWKHCIMNSRFHVGGGQQHHAGKTCDEVTGGQAKADSQKEEDVQLGTVVAFGVVGAVAGAGVAVVILRRRARPVISREANPHMSALQLDGVHVPTVKYGVSPTRKGGDVAIAEVMKPGDRV